MSSLFGDPPPSPIPHDWGTAPCLDLINSRWSDHLGRDMSYDRLPVARFRRTFLDRWHLKVEDADDQQAVADLARLRVLLRTVLERYARGRPVTPALQRNLESEMNRSPMAIQLERDRSGLRLQQRRSGRDWDVVIAEIATSAARLIAERRTIKVCANPDCSWMFVDESKPRTRRWCNTSVCGSLLNVRHFRQINARSRQRSGAQR